MVSAGQVIRASDITTQGCRVTRTVAQSIPNSTTTLVTFDDEVDDDTGMHSTVTNTSRITIAVAGWYHVGFNGHFAAGNDYTRTSAILTVSGTTDIAREQIPGTSASVQQFVSVATAYKFAAGDYIEVSVIQLNTATAARNLEVSADKSPQFFAVRIGS